VSSRLRATGPQEQAMQRQVLNGFSIVWTIRKDT